MADDSLAAAAEAKTEKARIKKLKKEEGRRRAIEIARERQRKQQERQREGSDIGSDDIASCTSNSKRDGQKGGRRSGRHGARNQHRHKFFAKWLLSTFPHLSQQQDSNPSNGLPVRQQHVLDVAGGKGELAARLSMCHNLQVVLVDPRKADVSSCFTSLVLPKLPNKWQHRIQQQISDDPDFIDKKINERVRQLVMTFDDDTVEQSPELQAAIQSATLLIGMHADGATEAIVDAALKYGKPFIVVPCCVFPRLFSQRYLVQDDGSKVQVRSHEQFCQYLLSKDERFKREILPFEGRNIGIWWEGKT
mmetsp:Transcript_11289/g.23086  ORF Transcript_11289/g.23086 Transcript_11289/m.23086 type:complete len:306 (+) Transcript_11289:972-1889(+)